MAFFCPGAAHGTAKKKAQTQMGLKPVSLSQGTSPITPGPPSLGDKGGGDGGKTNGNLTLTLPHSNTQAMMKKMIVVQKYEPKPGDKGLLVKRGETVLMVRDDGEWLYVKNEKGDEGFVPRSHLLSPSRTRTRTNSRSGTALRHVASNGSVPMHSTRLADRSPNPDSPTVITSTLSQDDYHHSHHSHHHHLQQITSNGHHPPPLRPIATETLYDRKYSPSSSSGVASLADQFSPGLTHSLTQDREQEEQAQSSSSSLNHSHDSYSSYEPSLDATSNQPTLISPLNHIEGGRESLRRAGGRRGGGVSPGSNEALPHSNFNSGRATAESCGSSRLTPVQNGMDGIHYVDKTTNHIYSTLEQPPSPPPPPLPPRNIPAYSASQEPEQNMYSQLEHNTGISNACSQEALVHPSHPHDSYSEGWTREQNSLAARNGTARSRSYKEQVKIRRATKPRSVQGTEVTRTERHQQHQTRRERTKITKFRKTVWGVFVVTHDFDPLDENEISIRKGEHVSVWNRDDRDWFWVVKHASSGSEEGFVPSGCLREVSADSKTSAAVKSGSHHNSNSPTTPISGSPRLDDIATADPMRHRTHSQESRTSSHTHQSRPHRPSSGGLSSTDCRRERRGSEGSAQVHGVHNRDLANPSVKHKEPLPPSPPSSPPPPYSEFDTNSRRFMSLSQQQPEVHHSQPSGYGHRHGHGMHRTRSQGYVTSRSRAVHYPSSPSSPHGRGGEGRMFPDGGTLV